MKGCLETQYSNQAYGLNSQETRVQLLPGKRNFSIVGFEVLTSVVMRAAIIWDILACSLYVN
jgi:hypothetical protein